jgi:hypothetical protein
VTSTGSSKPSPTRLTIHRSVLTDGRQPRT